jgi:hypothetical protein
VDVISSDVMSPHPRVRGSPSKMEATMASRRKIDQQAEQLRVARSAKNAAWIAAIARMITAATAIVTKFMF